MDQLDDYLDMLYQVRPVSIMCCGVVMRYDVICDMMRFGVVRYDVVWYDVVRYDREQFEVRKFCVTHTMKCCAEWSAAA